jgi:hypothetical protein
VGGSCQDGVEDVVEATWVEPAIQNSERGLAQRRAMKRYLRGGSEEEGADEPTWLRQSGGSGNARVERWEPQLRRESHPGRIVYTSFLVRFHWTSG